MKNNQAVFRTITQILFIVIAFIVSIIVANGFSLDFTKIWSWEFAVEVLSKLIITLLTYNIVFSMDSQNRRRAGNTSYFITVMTNRERIDKIYKDNRIAELDEVLKKYNEESYIKACNRKLHNYSSRISFDKLNLELGLIKEIKADIKERFKLSGRTLRRISRVIKKIQSGKIKFEKVEADDILVDKDEKNDKQVSMILNTGTFILKQNLIKAVTFLLGVVFMTVINPNNGDINIWVEIAKNSTLLLGGIVSAMTLSANYIKMRTDTFELRNRFLLNRMKLDDTFEYTK